MYKYPNKGLCLLECVETMKVNKRLMGDRCRERGGLNFPVLCRGK